MESKKSCGVCSFVDKSEYLQKQNQLLKEDNKKLRDQIKKYKYDSMTGLLGRSDFNDTFDNLWYDYETFGHNFGLAIIDLNGLHNINREFGFAAGDAFIIDTADVIKALFTEASAYRTSGDEFFLLKKGSNCEILAQRLAEIPSCEYGFVQAKDGFTTASDMFNYCDNLVIDKKQLNAEERA